jgi:uncharacterized protein (DUF433 family)
MLEEYFEFVAPDYIKIKGHRIGIEDVLKYHLQGYTPEDIQEELPSLSLEKIYATLTYYYHNKEEVDKYINSLNAQKEARYRKWAANPSPLIQRLQNAKLSRKLSNPI